MLSKILFYELKPNVSKILESTKIEAQTYFLFFSPVRNSESIFTPHPVAHFGI